jgi:hypothetical protein
MGKRSDFVRVERDFYPTPREAVTPLMCVLPDSLKFVEPCAGDGALISHLKSGGHSCVYACDIEPRDPSIEMRNALDGFPTNGANCIITNPPWDRALLHPMIEKFSSILPTWLLFDADWMHTKQSIPFMPLLRAVVSVGRVKWIPDSKMTGKDNCAWYFFAPGHGDTIFIGRNG